MKLEVVSNAKGNYNNDFETNNTAFGAETGIVTYTIDTYVYNGLMKLGDVGMSSAASFYQSIVGFILVMFSNWLVKKRNMEGSLF